MRFFISYSRKDAEFTNQISDYIRELEHYVWIDRMLVSGDRWWEIILSEIEDCDCLIAFLTPRSVASIYCAAERDYALQLGKTILPFFLSICEIPEKLQSIQTPNLKGLSVGDAFTVIEKAIETNVNKSVINKRRYDKRKRPQVPQPSKENIDQLISVLEDADDAFRNSNWYVANMLYQFVYEGSDAHLSKRALARLTEVRCRKAYTLIQDLITDRNNLPQAQVHLKRYRQNGCAYYDPDDLISVTELWELVASPEQRNEIRILTDKQHNLSIRIKAAERLALIGDPRPSVGLNIENNLPDIIWRETLVRKIRTDQTVRVFLSKYPITQIQFQAFRDKGYNDPEWWQDNLIVSGRVPPSPITNYPVVSVTWFEAKAFCKWLGKQLNQDIDLPTEDEWLSGGQGATNNSYPWGVDYVPGRANVREANGSVEAYYTGGTTPVGVYLEVADSPLKISEMYGNVWEWIQKPFRNVHKVDNQPVCGGGWQDRGVDTNLFSRRTLHPRQHFIDVGFRIALYLPVV